MGQVPLAADTDDWIATRPTIWRRQMQRLQPAARRLDLVEPVLRGRFCAQGGRAFAQCCPYVDSFRARAIRCLARELAEVISRPDGQGDKTALMGLIDRLGLRAKGGAKGPAVGRRQICQRALDTPKFHWFAAEFPTLSEMQDRRFGAATIRLRLSKVARIR